MCSGLTEVTGFVPDTGRFIVTIQNEGFRPGTDDTQAKVVRLQKKNLSKTRRDHKQMADERWDALQKERTAQEIALQLGLKARQAQLLAAASARAPIPGPYTSGCWSPWAHGRHSLQ